MIICYGRWSSNHVAVRVTRADGTVLLWDPGGGYFVHEPDTVGRRADVVTLKPPTLGQWWRYRRSFTREPFNAVFEWDVASQDAEMLVAALQTGASDGAKQDGFQTQAIRGECALGVSDYLRQYATTYLAMEKRYLWPHALGRHLWAQDPDRVIIFRIEGDTEVWTRD